MYNKDIVNKIRSFYRKDINILELELVNYEGVNYYIRLDTNKKDEFFLRSVNLNITNKFDKRLINQEILIDQPVNAIADILNKVAIRDLKVNNLNLSTDYVSFKAKISDIEYKYEFNLFIPKSIGFLSNIFFIIFSNLPKRMFPLLEELNASLEKKEMKYLYRKPFKFNIFKDDLEKLFDKKTVEIGEKQYNNQYVRFLELINETYYAIVEDVEHKSLFALLVNYNKKSHITSLFCSCPKECYCEHMYAVLRAIRNNESFYYYKVRFINNPESNMYDKLFTLNYYLCLGIDKNYLILLYPNGVIEAVPALNKDGSLAFEVVEDDEDHNLKKQLNQLKK